MNTKLKNTLITITTTLSAILIVSTIVYAGTLTPSGTAGDATQYTLNDIYTKLTTGTATSTKSGSISVPIGAPSASFRTLTEIYNALPEWLTLSNSTTTVSEGFYEATTLTAVDSDLTAENIADGVTIFGVEGTLEAGSSELEWSTDQGFASWATAVSTCEGGGMGGMVDGSTGWRLPTFSELVAGMSDDWVTENDNTGDRFQIITTYWSSSAYDESNAWQVYWFDGLVNAHSSKGASYQFKCVR